MDLVEFRAKWVDMFEKLSKKNQKRILKQKYKERELRPLGSGGERIADLVVHPKYGKSVRKISYGLTDEAARKKADMEWKLKKVLRGRGKFTHILGEETYVKPQPRRPRASTVSVRRGGGDVNYRGDHTTRRYYEQAEASKKRIRLVRKGGKLIKKRRKLLLAQKHWKPSEEEAGRLAKVNRKLKPLRSKLFLGGDVDTTKRLNRSKSVRKAAKGIAEARHKPFLKSNPFVDLHEKNVIHGKIVDFLRKGDPYKVGMSSTPLDKRFGKGESRKRFAMMKKKAYGR